MSIERLIACAARRRKISTEAPIELIRKHGLGPLAHRLGSAGLQRDAIASALMYEHQEKVTREVTSALARRGVPVMLIKGMASARRHYDEPGDRPMTDVDLLVAADAHAEAAKAIRQCGFWPAGEPRERGRFHHALTLKRPGAAIDLHRSIVQPTRRGSTVRGLWQRAEKAPPEFGEALLPDRVDEALLTLAHIARHELAVRALSYVDAARMLELLDRNELERRARRAKLWRGVRLAMAICDALASERVPARLRPLVDLVVARREPSRPRQILRKLQLLDDPIEAARLGVGALFETLGF